MAVLLAQDLANVEAGIQECLEAFKRTPPSR
jgi:hypothetical protein